MVESSARSRPARPDGFTLVEIVIVVGMLGIIVTALGATISVVLRNSPPAEVRADDARSMQGLVTWLPQDVDAAPPGGFNRDHGYWPCSGAVPADSHNVLTVEWTERNGIDTTYAASYRYELRDGDWYMARYTCEDAGVADRNSLTSALPAWSASTPPARVEMCASTVSAGGECPAADVIPDAVAAPPEVSSLKLSITRPDGGIVTIDAAPKNPDQDLADDPDATPNAKPTLTRQNHVLQMFAGDTVTIDLLTTHGAADPDGDPISAAIDSTEPMPAGITAVASDPLFLEVTTDPSLPVGVLSPKIVMIVSDNHAGWVDATVTVEIVPRPNDPPTATSSTYHLVMQAGQTVTLPLDSTHGLSDPNGDLMTATVLSYPPFFTNPPKADSPGPLDLEVKTPASAPIGVALAPIALRIADGKGGVLFVDVTVEIAAPAPNLAPTAAATNLDIDMYPGDSIDLELDVSHGVGDPDGDPLSIVAVGDPTGLSSTLTGPLDVTIDTDAGLVDGTVLVSSYDIEDLDGAAVTVTVTVTVVPPPPPPSDCVLGTLTASPGTIARHGSGGPNAKELSDDVTVTVTFSGTCDGLTLQYDSGDGSGLGVGTGRVFPPGSPSSIVILGKGSGGSEKWSPTTHTLTAATTSDVTPNTITTTLTVT